MGKKLTQEELKTIAADVIIHKLPIYEASEKYHLSFETVERVERYGRAGYDLAKGAKAKLCPKCGEVLDKKMRFCWKCGTKAEPDKDEILDALERLLKILATFPSSSSDVGISLIRGIKDYIKREDE